jgi:putative glycosyltransferase (TIGR04348 family)
VKKPSIVIVTPALAAANNGNWQTARRWSRLLAVDYQVQVTEVWPGPGPGPGAKTASAADPQLMIALHARRSAASLLAWRARHPDRPLVLVLTGTDLYRDIQTDTVAQQSLQLADRLLVLNELGAAALPPEHRAKTSVCLQSSPTRKTLPKTRRHLRALMVGHLRDEKSPRSYFDAARRLAARHDILLDHIGGELDPALGAEARALMASQPNYRWLGALPHAATRARIQAAHLLVHPSQMEGGAQVVIEALTAGTPVLASRIAGNLGLLGDGYRGVFDWGDAAGLAALLAQARDDPAMLPALQAQCALRAPLFNPDHERQTLLDLLATLLAPSFMPMSAPGTPPHTETAP